LFDWRFNRAALDICERSLCTLEVFAEQCDDALRRGIVEKPREVPRRLIGHFSASGEEVAFVRGECGFDIIGSGNQRSGEFCAIVHGKIRTFARERRHQMRRIPQ
jgi:hypothetical protein